MGQVQLPQQVEGQVVWGSLWEGVTGDSLGPLPLGTRGWQPGYGSTRTQQNPSSQCPRGMVVAILGHSAPSLEALFRAKALGNLRKAVPNKLYPLPTSATHLGGPPLGQNLMLGGGAP